MNVCLQVGCNNTAGPDALWCPEHKQGMTTAPNKELEEHRSNIHYCWTTGGPYTGISYGDGLQLPPPKHLGHVTPQSIPTVVRDKLAAVMIAGDMALLLGPKGTGKTCALWAAAYMWLYREVRARFKFIKWPKLLELTNDASHGNSDARTALSQLKQLQGLLLLDDLCYTEPKADTRAYIFDLLDYRYEHNKPTIANTNCSPDEITQTLGGNVLSRFEQSGLIHLTQVHDFRTIKN